MKLDFSARVVKGANVTGVITVAGIIAYSIAGCSHTTSPAAPSGAVPVAATPAAATPAAEPGVTAYLCPFTDEDMLLQWNVSNEELSGTYQDAAISGTAPQELVNTSQGGLSGTTTGSSVIALTFASATWHGSVSGSSVTLNIPQTDGSVHPVICNRARASAWNGVVSQLNGQIASDNSAARQQSQASGAAAQQQAQPVSQAQQSLSRDISTLENDASTLNGDTSLAGDISAMTSDYRSEQLAYQTEQSAGCPAAGGDAGTAGGDAGTVGGAQGTLNGAIAALQSSRIAGVSRDTAAVNADLSTLSSLDAGPELSASSALATGSQAIKNANAAIAGAQQQGQAIVSEANQLATTAQKWASQHGC